MLQTVADIGDSVKPLSNAAQGEAEKLGHEVKFVLLGVISIAWEVSRLKQPRLVSIFENQIKPLVDFLTPCRLCPLQVTLMSNLFPALAGAAIGAASKTNSSQMQTRLLEQSKTLTESALQVRGQLLGAWPALITGCGCR